MSLRDAIDVDVPCCVVDCGELVRIHDWRDAGLVPCADHEDSDEDLS